MERRTTYLLAGFGGEGSDEPCRVEQTDMETADRELLDLRLGLSLGGGGAGSSSSARSIPAATQDVAPAPSGIIAGAIRADVEAERITAAPIPAEQSIPSHVFPMMMLDKGLLAEGSSSVVMPSSSFSAIEANNEDMIMKEMPFLYTTGISNNRTIKGILYKYRKWDEVTIVCVCHGSFLTPMEFVRHTGGGDVINPLKHIFMASA